MGVTSCTPLSFYWTQSPEAATTEGAETNWRLTLPSRLKRESEHIQIKRARGKRTRHGGVQCPPCDRLSAQAGGEGMPCLGAPFAKPTFCFSFKGRSCIGGAGQCWRSQLRVPRGDPPHMQAGHSVFGGSRWFPALYYACFCGLEGL